MIRYSHDHPLTPAQFVDVLKRSGLADRRPVDDAGCIRKMLDHADLLVTAWEKDTLIGVARSVTDFSYCCYLSDLAVDRAHQKQGVGKKLIELTRQKLGPRCRIILLSAPDATGYYPRLGFDLHPSAWTLPADRPLA